MAGLQCSSVQGEAALRAVDQELCEKLWRQGVGGADAEAEQQWPSPSAKRLAGIYGHRLAGTYLHIRRS